MAKIFTDAEIQILIEEKKPITLADVQKLKAPRRKKNQSSPEARVDINGKNGRSYRIIARRNERRPMFFSVILALTSGVPKQLNLIRCNGHHAEHDNFLESTVVPADTCHIHRVTERYLRSPIAGEHFATVTEAFRNFDHAVDYMSWSFGVYIVDDPWRGGLFRGQD